MNTTLAMTWDEMTMAVTGLCAALVIITPLVVGTIIKLLPQWALLKKAIEELDKRQDRQHEQIQAQQAQVVTLATQVTPVQSTPLTIVTSEEKQE